MNISNAATFLISRAVELATGLQKREQDSSGSSKNDSIKTIANDGDKNNTIQYGKNSAYRVTISDAAMKKLALSSSTEAIA
ncbi:MAG: hypothetical protein H7832_07215 [Magnetococcus sp. DMHC-6]